MRTWRLLVTQQAGRGENPLGRSRGPEVARTHPLTRVPFASALAHGCQAQCGGERRWAVMSPVRGPRPAAVVLGWEGRAGSAGSRTIHGRTAATWRWIGQGEVTLEPRSRGIGFPGDPEPKCRSRLRKQCLHRKAGVACRLPASVGADGGGLRARPRVAEARGWTGSVCDAARENADVFPTRGFQRLRSWARGSAWGHAVLRHAASLTGRAGRSSWASPAPQGPGRRECSASVRGCRHRTFAASRFL